MKFKVVKEENSFSAPYYCYAVYADGELLKKFTYDPYRKGHEVEFSQSNARIEAIKYVDRFEGLMQGGVCFKVTAETIYEKDVECIGRPIN